MGRETCSFMWAATCSCSFVVAAWWSECGALALTTDRAIMHNCSSVSGRHGGLAVLRQMAALPGLRLVCLVTWMQELPAPF